MISCNVVIVPSSPARRTSQAGASQVSHASRENRDLLSETVTTILKRPKQGSVHRRCWRHRRVGGNDVKPNKLISLPARPNASPNFRIGSDTARLFISPATTVFSISNTFVRAHFPFEHYQLCTISRLYYLLAAMKNTVVVALVAFAASSIAADDSYLQQASDAYSSAVNAASGNLDKAKSIISEQISGTPKPIHEEMLSSADSAYSGAVAAASSRMSAAGASLSSISNSAFPTQGSLESISSAASANYQSALAAASSQYASAKIAVGATPTPASQKYLDDARRSYYEAVGYAYEQYDDYVAAASSAVYGAPTGSVESATSAAAENWASLVSAASSRI